MNYSKTVIFPIPSIGSTLINDQHVTEKEGRNGVALTVGPGGNQTSCIGFFFLFSLVLDSFWEGL